MPTRDVTSGEMNVKTPPRRAVPDTGLFVALASPLKVLDRTGCMLNRPQK